MKKFLLISLIISSFNMNAEWVFVDESEGVLGVAKGSNLYVWKYYNTDDSGMRNFKILTNFKKIVANEASSIAKWGVYCNRPHRLYLQDVEGFNEKNGKGRSVYLEENVAYWITVPDDSVLRKSINMVCSN